ncbi:acyltransferase 3 [Apodospora peruviana]|uniref:Acyltransferase 3 n=1 Tax=Apodospora peruviana TaxID=516989 RepID=A0AAE0HV87_9PEZI|nr:acyltransferase 3 [Apodospora peruviana]
MFSEKLPYRLLNLRPFPARPLTHTTCLHGLRGLAAVAVFVRHLLISFWEYPDHGCASASSPELAGNNKICHHLPIPLRILFAGNAMVSVFFVVSGYLDSIKPLQFIHAHQFEALQAHTASSVLRRGPRLFLPALAASTLISVAVWLGLYEWGLAYRLTFFDSLPPHLLSRHANPFTQLAAMLASFRKLFDLFNFKPINPKVNMHYWTLPYDLRGTLVRHLAIMSTSRLTPMARMAAILILILFCGSYARWELALNLCGLLLCQIDILFQARARTTKDGEKQSWRWVNTMLIVASLYLCTYPKENGAQTPGYRLLGKLAPTPSSSGWQDYRWWNSWAAVMLVWGVLHQDSASKFLEGGVPQYLGSISFAVYLLHGPVLHITAYEIIPMTWTISDGSVFGDVLGFLLPTLLVVVPCVLLAADLFARTIEVKCYGLIQRAERALLDDRGKESCLS